jgi:glucose/arabinose dehydrogenase
MHSQNRSWRRALQALICLWGLVLSGIVAEAFGQEAGRDLVVPDGFRVQVFAEGLGAPTGMVFGTDGRLYVTEQRRGRVLRIVDHDGDGRADSVTTVIEDLDRPFGIEWGDGGLWVAESARVIRLDGPFTSDTRSDFAVVVDQLPAGGTAKRSLVLAPSGRTLFLSIGSSCDLCREEDPRGAAILRYNLDGSEEEVWARGLRSSMGLAFHPVSGELWATENGRDWLGDDLPPDELNVVVQGGNYGWPYCYGSRIPSPEYADPARCDVTEPPVMLFPAHSSPLGITFYTAEMFPTEYQGDAFVALHGSRNLSAPAGYKVVRLEIEGGRPVAAEDFITGWVGAGPRILGRPVQPLVGPDGALYVSDDYGGRVWRVVAGGGEVAIGCEQSTAVRCRM